MSFSVSNYVLVEEKTFELHVKAFFRTGVSYSSFKASKNPKKSGQQVRLFSCGSIK